MDTKSSTSPDLKAEEKQDESITEKEQVSKSALVTDEPEISDAEEARRMIESYTPEEAKRILRKVDYRLVPLLAVLYLLAFIDRGNSM